MSSFRAPLLALLCLGSFGVYAQTPPAVVRGAIERGAPDGANLVLRTREGHEETIRLSGETTVTLVLPASLADVKPGAFIGVAALPDADGGFKAMEVHVFPEAMRGTGEGHRPFDLAPGASMTNGAVSARVDSVDGAKLTVDYNGGKAVIAVAPGTPIVSFAPGARTDLKPGAALVVRGPAESDGSIAAARILVGKDGLVPPL